MDEGGHAVACTEALRLENGHRVLMCVNSQSLKKDDVTAMLPAFLSSVASCPNENGLTRTAQSRMFVSLLSARVSTVVVPSLAVFLVGGLCCLTVCFITQFR